jgi:hypothetical protein
MQWAAMNPSPRLRLSLRPSRTGAAAIIAACTLTSILLASLPLPMAALGAGAVLIATVLGSGLRRCAGRGVPALLDVGVDRRIAVTDRTGRSRAGSIHDDSYVGACLTTIVWRADGERWWRPARTVVILPDSLPRDEFRRLRVVLRYGRPVAETDTSGEEAG